MKQILDYFADQGVSLVDGMRRGIEKENLRVDVQGHNLRDAHPASLGASITHPYITTDFAENLIEVVTMPCDSREAVLHQLGQISGFVAANIGKQQLWPLSMPPQIKDPGQVRIAEYGSSNSAHMKRIYRIGLSHRYGRLMQVIAGIHYNVSVGDQVLDTLSQGGFKQDYMSLTRQFLRHYPILIYLFGAAPVCDRSFAQHNPPDFLQKIEPDALGAEFATSLRMSSLGYHNPAQANVPISYNSVPDYVKSLLKATRTPYSDYIKIGIETPEGYRQLNGNVIQIENEYYSPIRPKQLVARCERPASALANRGVDYVEMRCVDLNPLHPLGVSDEQLQFYDLFLLWCLLGDTQPLSHDDNEAMKRCVEQVAIRGRDPALIVHVDSESILFRDWAKSIINAMHPLAVFLDQHGGEGYESCLARQFAKLENDALTPSAMILDEMSAGQYSMQDYGCLVAQQQSKWLKSQEIDTQFQQKLLQAVEASFVQKRQLEHQSGSFTDYLKCYFDGDCRC